MKGFYIVLLVVASLVLGFCLAAAVTAQASFTWWKAEKGPNGTKEVYFGLYRICTKHTDQRNEIEKCHRFDETGITEFFKDNTLTTADVNIGMRNSMSVFFACVCIMYMYVCVWIYFE